jgi:nicotinamidase-related amidase
MSQERSFLEWLSDWESGLPELELKAVITQAERVALLSVDLIKGFTTVGPLASPRIAGVVPTVAQLFKRAYELGVRHFLLTQDSHTSEAAEFAAYPPHCLAGSTESETVDELSALPFADLFVVFPKNTTSSTLGTGLEAWLNDHPEVTTFIVVGDCTDICVYQLALDLRLRANLAGRKETRVIVPADCVQTYDLPVKTAVESGGLPHAFDLLHRVFLYHMELNGIEVVARLI